MREVESQKKQMSFERTEIQCTIKCHEQKRRVWEREIRGVDDVKHACFVEVKMVSRISCRVSS